MLRDQMTMLILSCDAFSDLWDGHVKLLEENWPDREMDTYLVTDAPTDKRYDHVKIIAAGADLAWSERLSRALDAVRTPYVFVTLDDYFLIRKVPTGWMVQLLALMERHSLDYVRLYPKPENAARESIEGDKNVFRIDNKTEYGVNLYSSIWRADFLQSTVSEKRNIWEYEVSLPKAAVDYGAKCAVSKNQEFKILDVVRKGKLLHAANAYFRKHPGVYAGNRELQTWSYEAKLWVKTMVSWHTHGKLRKFIRDTLRKRGYQFYSDGFENWENEGKT